MCSGQFVASASSPSLWLALTCNGLFVGCVVVGAYVSNACCFVCIVVVAVQETCNSPKRTFICYILVGISYTKQPRTIFGTLHPKNSPSNIPKSTLRNLAALKSIWSSKNSFQKDLQKSSQSQAYAILNPKAPGAHGKPAPNCESRRIKANA